MKKKISVRSLAETHRHRYGIARYFLRLNMFTFEKHCTVPGFVLHCTPYNGGYPGESLDECNPPQDETIKDRVI